MGLEVRDGASFRLSTRNLPPSRGLSALQDMFEQVVHLDFRAQPGASAQAEMAVHAVPDLRWVRMVSSVAAHLARPKRMLADGDDSACLIVKTGGRLALAQRRQEAVARAGDGLLLLFREPADLHFVDMTYQAVRVPYSELALRAVDVGAAAARCIPRETEALRLLRVYLAGLPARMADAELRRLAAAHVYDLIALAIGATGEGRETAARRGLRAARLEAIKADLAGDASLGLDQVAARQGISPRYVQMLFEEDGTTFTAFVLERRLDAARRMLASPRFARWSVTAIALEAGFGDLSHFNRRFKRRYGMTPSDLRALDEKRNGRDAAG